MTERFFHLRLYFFLSKLESSSGILTSRLLFAMSFSFHDCMGMQS